MDQEKVVKYLLSVNAAVDIQTTVCLGVDLLFERYSYLLVIE